MMQDPNPLPWGAQDRFQAHFVVQQDIGNDTESVFRSSASFPPSHLTPITFFEPK